MACNFTLVKFSAYEIGGHRILEGLHTRLDADISIFLNDNHAFLFFQNKTFPWETCLFVRALLHRKIFLMESSQIILIAYFLPIRFYLKYY